MKILSTFRHFTVRPAFFWVAVLLLLSQTIVVSYLAQPVPVQNNNGQWVTICTLQGLKQASLADTENPEQGNLSFQCPACTLSSVAGTALLLSAPVIYFPPSSNRTLFVEKQSLFTSSVLVARNIRAPPVA